MTTRLWVNWSKKEILTNQQLEEKINKRVESVMSDDVCYNEYLDDYIDCNYTKLELFNALTSDGASIEETIDDIREGVAEEIYDWCNEDIRWEYEKVKIEV